MPEIILDFEKPIEQMAARRGYRGMGDLYDEKGTLHVQAGIYRADGGAGVRLHADPLSAASVQGAPWQCGGHFSGSDSFAAGRGARVRSGRGSV